MATMTESAAKAIRDYADPALAAVEDGIRDGVRDMRRAAVAGSYAVEDYADGATVQIRRHPFLAVAMAIGTGALVGCVIGFAAGRSCRDSRVR